MLTGTYPYQVDKKGRVIIPPRFHHQLGQAFVLTRAPGRCLLALPRPRWERFVRSYGRNRTFRTFFLAAATHVPIGPGNRIMVPVALRDWAGLSPHSEVVVAGIGQAVIISSRARWEARLLQIEQDLLTALECPELRLCSACQEPEPAKADS